MSATQDPHDAPSGATLLKAAIAATVLAAIVLVTVILPAEFGIDPSGAGERLGLTALAEASVEGAANDGTPVAGAPDASGSGLDRQEPRRITVEVPAGAGVEYKFRMNAGGKMAYEWTSDGRALHLDLHGEPAGDDTGYFESYVVATASEMSGSFTVPFDGSHGWYWRNDGDEDATVELTVAGQFEVIGLK